MCGLRRTMNVPQLKTNSTFVEYFLVLSDALTEPTSDYKRPHSTKIIMSAGKVFIPSMCKVSATMKVSRLSAMAKRSIVLQENSNKCEASSNLNKNLVYLKECSPMSFWPGSTYDSHVFRTSNICTHLQINHRSLDDGVLLGDSGYLCSPF